MERRSVRQAATDQRPRRAVRVRAAGPARRAAPAAAARGAPSSGGAVDASSSRVESRCSLSAACSSCDACRPGSARGGPAGPRSGAAGRAAGGRPSRSRLAWPSRSRTRATPCAVRHLVVERDGVAADAHHAREARRAARAWPRPPARPGRARCGVWRKSSQLVHRLELRPDQARAPPPGETAGERAARTAATARRAPRARA